MDNRMADERKRALRAHFRRLRSELGTAARTAADAEIERRVRALPAFAQADVILTYLDVGTEVRTRGIIEAAWAAGKEVALPRCVPHTCEMRWYRVYSLDALVRGPHGVDEPVADPACEQSLDDGRRLLALVPGLSFDAAGYRLGYGGGFYDAFLSVFDGVSVGLCRAVQLSRDLRAAGAVEPHDLPVQLVVSDGAVSHHP